MVDNVLTQEKSLEELLKLDYRRQNLVRLTQELINLPNDTANLEVKKQLANHLVGLLRQNPFTQDLKVNSQSLTNPKEATELLNDINNAFTLTVAPEDNLPQPEVSPSQNAPLPGQTKTPPSPSSDRASLLDKLFKERWEFIRREAPKNKARLDALAKAEEILGRNFAANRQTILNEINFYLTQSPIDPKFIPGIIEGIALKLNPKPAAAANLKQALIPAAEAVSSTTPFPNLDQIVTGLIADHSGDPATLQAELTRVALPPSIQIAFTQLQSADPQDRDQGRLTFNQIGRANPQLTHIIDQITSTPKDNFTSTSVATYSHELFRNINPNLDNTLTRLPDLNPPQLAAALQNLPSQLHQDTTSTITSELTLRSIEQVRARTIATHVTNALRIVTFTQPGADHLSESLHLLESTHFTLNPAEKENLSSLHDVIKFLAPTDPLATVIQSLPPEIVGNQTLITNFRDLLHTQIGIPQEITDSLEPQQVLKLSLHHFALNNVGPKTRLKTLHFLDQNHLSFDQLLRAWVVNADQTTPSTGKPALPQTLTQFLKNPTRVHQMLGHLGIKLPTQVEKAIKFSNFLQNPFGALKSFLGSGFKSAFSNLSTSLKAGGKQLLSAFGKWGSKLLVKLGQITAGAFSKLAAWFVTTAIPAITAALSATASAVAGLAAAAGPVLIILIPVIIVLAIVVVAFAGLLQTGPEQASQLYTSGAGGIGEGQPYTGPRTPFDITGKICWPVTGSFNGYMPENHPSIAGIPNASAIDIDGPIGTVVITPFDGRVLFAGWDNSGYGNLVELAVSLPTQSGNRSCQLLFGHLSSVSDVFSVHDNISAGTPVGLRGSTGNSSGPHTHYEVRCNDGGLPPDIRSLFPPPDQNVQSGDHTSAWCYDGDGNPSNP